ncbi:hypothetical protein EGW08_012302 [Elysia chlorotica]|uniref:Uncharacterized protein n=1 Tax=Elysia chlorotica TaxID=188477 RepID=A0A3S1B4W1_ELYCH|nr:hypothetical protein EGW08_012302 [Elysia chlorotica]
MDSNVLSVKNQKVLSLFHEWISHIFNDFHKSRNLFDKFSLVQLIFTNLNRRIIPEQLLSLRRYMYTYQTAHYKQCYTWPTLHAKENEPKAPIELRPVFSDNTCL